MDAKICFLTPVLLSAAMAAELPVREVTLYKHGVGYFERSGQLAPGESARLDFKASEMNDVLKSLTIEDKGGGKVSGLRYDSSEPLSVKLDEFPFRIGEQQPLSAVLDQLKGARIELKLGSETVSGIIAGARRIAGDSKQPEREQITLLLDSSDLHNYDLAAAASIRFTDPKLQAQFKDYLATLANARSKDRRSVYIDSTDAKLRQIVASYMIPAPVWKSSYRLIFDQTPQPTLEGWAIVDNTTGEDWNKVQLSLVSGRPISFVSLLYEPRYIQRRVAGLPEDQSVGPVVYEGGIAGGVAGGIAGLPPPVPKAMEKPPGRPMNGRREADMSDRSGPANQLAMLSRSEISSSVASTADTRELGDLFEYRISTPVTIRKSESAMLPFLQQKLTARKLLIFTDQNSVHPLNAAEITNSTGKTLDGGPITVFDGGAYAGEALMETLKTGDKRLISYAVDLGARITSQLDSKNDLVREVHVSRGMLTTRTAQAQTKTYTIRNVDRKAKTLIIEHPIRPQYTLLNQKPSETTNNAYRFEIKLAPGATEKFPVMEEHVYESSFEVMNLTPDILITYVRNKSVSDSARKQLEQVVEKKRQIAGAENEIRRIQAQINDMVRDQDRIRQNINSLNQVSGQQQQVQTYARQLATQESQLASLRDQVSDLQRKRDAAMAELNSLLESISF